MNYRHAFHAGNFADVVKHAVLARILVYLCAKPAAFRVIDTHAGGGLYDLAGPEATRSLEWRAGIGRLFGNAIPDAARPLLASYLDVVAGLNPTGRLAIYPGSPTLARAWLRPQDRLVACEVEPNTLAALRRNLGPDRRVRIVPMDGWIALKAYVPPIERRGLILIDPSFEDDADFTRLGRGLEAAHRKWPGGIYVLWYPLKGRRGLDTLALTLKRSGIGKILRIELCIGAIAEEGPLGGCGLIVVNPPWTLESELAAILPALQSMLAGEAGSHRLDWLAGK
ncbi:MAG TPA: 23S rRNA (adenine(2030)-N(6))-methyltransferase RlmJ [Xanthobacteraceae bacterium]|jgi:23S rRNA (adenine2030-N6)-methyltransferase